MATQSGVHRRCFIVGAAGVSSALAFQGGAGEAIAQEAKTVGASKSKPLPGYVSWKDPDALIVHSTNTLETKRDAFGPSLVTAAEDLYVRNNLPAPPEEIVQNADDWEVNFEGVKKPRSFRLRELKNMGLDTVVMVLQCSGNGRAFFDHKTSGTQWSVGAAGNVVWAGIPLRTIVDALGGVADGRKFITGTGGEEIPKGVDPKTVIVERSVPLDALDNAILAWEMNGKPLAVAHGGPLRLVLPGYYGVNNVKYIKRLAFTEQESDANIQRTGYRVRPVGVKGAPDQPSMWEMTVKSWVTHPLRDARTGRLQIYGVAFGGVEPLKSVEVSIDGGKSWKEAKLIGPDLGRFAWRPFVLEAELAQGEHTIASRATDAKGNAQPEKFEPNERGYAHNGWADHAVDVKVMGG